MDDILIKPGVTGEVRFVNKLFDLAASSVLPSEPDSVRDKRGLALLPLADLLDCLVG
jgi:hypothetical protein